MRSTLMFVPRLVAMTLRLLVCLVLALIMAFVLLLAAPFNQADRVFRLWDNLLKHIWRVDGDSESIVMGDQWDVHS